MLLSANASRGSEWVSIDEIFNPCLTLSHIAPYYSVLVAQTTSFSRFSRDTIEM